MRTSLNEIVPIWNRIQNWFTINIRWRYINIATWISSIFWCQLRSVHYLINEWRIDSTFRWCDRPMKLHVNRIHHSYRLNITTEILLRMISREWDDDAPGGLKENSNRSTRLSYTFDRSNRHSNSNHWRRMQSGLICYRFSRLQLMCNKSTSNAFKRNCFICVESCSSAYPQHGFCTVKAFHSLKSTAIKYVTYFWEHKILEYRVNWVSVNIFSTQKLSSNT